MFSQFTPVSEGRPLAKECLENAALSRSEVLTNQERLFLRCCYMQNVVVFNHFNMAGGQPQLQTVEEWLDERHFSEEIIKIFTGEKMLDDK